MPFIQTLASIIVVAIENKRFSAELINKSLTKGNGNGSGNAKTSIPNKST